MTFFLIKKSMFYQWICYRIRIYLEKATAPWLYICQDCGFIVSCVMLPRAGWDAHDWCMSSASKLRGEFCEAAGRHWGAYTAEHHGSCGARCDVSNSSFPRFSILLYPLSACGFPNNHVCRQTQMAHGLGLHWHPRVSLQPVSEVSVALTWPLFPE